MTDSEYCVDGKPAKNILTTFVTTFYYVLLRFTTFRRPPNPTLHQHIPETTKTEVSKTDITTEREDRWPYPSIYAPMSEQPATPTGEETFPPRSSKRIADNLAKAKEKSAPVEPKPKPMQKPKPAAKPKVMLYQIMIFAIRSTGRHYRNDE